VTGICRLMSHLQFDFPISMLQDGYLANFASLSPHGQELVRSRRGQRTGLLEEETPAPACWLGNVSG